jgi:hypothetical protein
VKDLGKISQFFPEFKDVARGGPLGGLSRDVNKIFCVIFHCVYMHADLLRRSICIYRRTYTYIHTYIHIHVYIHTLLRPYCYPQPRQEDANAFVCVCVCVGIGVCVCVCVCVSMCQIWESGLEDGQAYFDPSSISPEKRELVCVCVCVCVCVSMCVCIYIYIYI